MGSFKEYDHYDGLGLAERVRRKEISPAELVEEAIRRIETVNPQINAIIHPMYDLARQQVQQGLPEGPFRGVPFLLKDLLVHHAGVPTRSGSRFFRDFIPDHDSEIVRRYRQAGAGLINALTKMLVVSHEAKRCGVQKARNGTPLALRA